MTTDPFHDVAATLRDAVHRTGAIRLHALVARGDVTALVTAGLLSPIEIQIGDDEPTVLDHAAPLGPGAAPAEALEALRQFPAWELDVAEGRVTGPIGALEHLADGLVGLAAGLGEGSVVVGLFESTDADTPLTLTARVGEPVLVALGDEHFDLPGSERGP